MTRNRAPRPRKTRSLTTALQATGAAFATAALAAACAGPNLRLQPQYVGPAADQAADINPAQANTAIAIRVTDARRHKGQESSRGGEIVAKGDKGQIVLEQDVADYVAENLAKAYRAAGFEVRKDADLIVDVKVRDLRVEALEFTHWGLPSDRASTLDLVGLVLPGPDRPARALAVLDVDLSKHGQALGLSYYVEGYARNDVDTADQVTDTITQSWSDAVNRVVRDTAAGLPILAENPVTDAEQVAAEQELQAQQEGLELALASLEERERLVAGDRAALEQARRDIRDEQAELEQQRQELAQRQTDNGQQIAAVQTRLDQALAEASSLGDSNRKLAQQLDALANERDELAAQTVALREQADAADREQRAALEARIADLDEDRADLATRLEGVQGQLADALAANAQTADLGAQLADLADQRAQLAAFQINLDTRSLGLRNQEDELAEQSTNVAAQLTELDERRAVIAQREQKLQGMAASIESRNEELDTWSDQLQQWKLDLAKAEQDRQAKQADIDAQLEALRKSEADLDDRQAKLEELEAERYAADRSIAVPTVEPRENRRPQIVLTVPVQDIPSTAEPQIIIDGFVFDDGEVESIRFWVNGNEIDPSTQKAGFGFRRISTADPELAPARTDEPGAGSRGFQQFSFAAPLTRFGDNDIRIVATDDEGESTPLDVTVERRNPAGQVHVLSIGVEQYNSTSGIPPLRYAVDDAQAVLDALETGLGVTGRRITLQDDQATRRNIVSAMTRGLRGLSRDDTAVIFFSGHGAPLAVPN
ncbi:MAG: hypothetical protein AAGA57_04965, partial [Planctomycetota bacterium]